MNKQVNNQPFLFKQPNSLSNNDRCRVDSFTNNLKDNNSLSHLGLPFDQDEIIKQDFDSFNPASYEMNKHDVVKQYQEYKPIQQSNNERKSTFSESLNGDYKNNSENIQKTDQWLSSVEKQVNVEKSYHSQALTDKLCQLKLTKHDITLLVLNILMILTLVLVYKFVNKSPSNKRVDNEEILVVKKGNIFGGPGGEDVLDDAGIATLSFNDAIIRVSATESFDLFDQPLLLCLTFTYSNGKNGRDYGGIGRTKESKDLSPLNLNRGEHIDQIIIYEDYRNITNPWRVNRKTYIIVGIHFKTNRDREILFGSTIGTNKTESMTNYFLGYVQGKAGGHIDSFRFIWYKYCPKNSSIIE